MHRLVNSTQSFTDIDWAQLDRTGDITTLPLSSNLKRRVSHDAGLDLKAVALDLTTVDRDLLARVKDRVAEIRETLTDLQGIIKFRAKYGDDAHVQHNVAKVLQRLRNQIFDLNWFADRQLPELEAFAQAIQRHIHDVDQPAAADNALVDRVETQLGQLHALIESSNTWMTSLELRLKAVTDTLPTTDEIKAVVKERSDQVRQTLDDTLTGLINSTLSGTFVEAIRQTYADPTQHPEVAWDAQVRLGNSLPDAEVAFRAARLERGRVAFARFIGVSASEVTLEDMPVIALGGSGGGYRAMVSTLGYVSACDEAGLLDCVTYMAGVSGSCWTLMQYFIAAHGSTAALNEHIAGQIATSLTSVSALADMLTSPAAASIFAGLVSKYDSGLPLSLVDVYGTLLMARLLTRALTEGAASHNDVKDDGKSVGAPSPYAAIKLSGQKRLLADGAHPMPIYTAVRHEILRTDGTTTQADDPERGQSSWTGVLPSVPTLSSLTNLIPLRRKASDGSETGAAEAKAEELAVDSNGRRVDKAAVTDKDTQDTSTTPPDASAVATSTSDRSSASSSSTTTAENSDGEDESANAGTALVSALGLSRTHKYQWFEFTPYEVGTAEQGVWVPAWAFGRRFRDGTSLERRPEPSVGLYLGMFGSAFCATIAHMIDEVKGILAAPVNAYLQSIVRDYELTITTTHPIAPSCFHNPFYRPSSPTRSIATTPRPSSPALNEGTRTTEDLTATNNQRSPSASPHAGSRHGSDGPTDSEPTTLYDSQQLCLMDAGMNNNLPFYPLLRPERGVDAVLLFDASSDIDETPWFERAEEYAKHFGIARWPRGAAPWPRPSSATDPTEAGSDKEKSKAATAEGQGEEKATAERKAKEGGDDDIKGEGVDGSRLSRVAMDPIAQDGSATLTDRPNPFADGHRCAVFTGSSTTEAGMPAFAEPGDQASATSNQPAGPHPSSPTPAPGDAVAEPATVSDPVTLVYYPLLANPEYEVADFDPATVDFCSTYNFSYTPDQVKNLADLSRCNFNQELETLRSTLRDVWKRKKARVAAAKREHV
ncbi:hypothetical protein IWQ60_001941 [Tieghemiomyces parasiticus]|uniref:Lysophospholipase n=1 Tax=Tieghemiomyces parasiticus TaxID=78921 RepID=A0A9W8E1G0_9FUNG|nr:hypothetical protein IWQ60_001941 [Tieghemiomyces parasiticus]